jgi:hypothetical protein
MSLIDFNAVLLSPVHDILGDAAAVLTPASSVGPLTLNAIDKSTGILVGVPGQPGVETLLPVAIIRMTELTAGGITTDDLEGAGLVLNSKAWRVDSWRPAPTPNGEAQGRLWLFLVEA